MWNKIKRFFRYDWHLFGKFNDKFEFGPFQFKNINIAEGLVWRCCDKETKEFYGSEVEYPVYRKVKVVYHNDTLINDFNKGGSIL
jgi:hypothetical protein